MTGPVSGPEKPPNAFVGQGERKPTPTRGVTVQLDKERHIRFSLGTLRKLREEFGENALEEGVGADSLAKLLWYGLKSEDPSLTVEDVEEMVDLENLEEMMAAVAKATGGRTKVSEAQMAAGFPRPAVANPRHTQESVPTSGT